jgi:hypothetical protein
MYTQEFITERAYLKNVSPPEAWEAEAMKAYRGPDS